MSVCALRALIVAYPAAGRIANVRFLFRKSKNEHILLLQLRCLFEKSIAGPCRVRLICAALKKMTGVFMFRKMTALLTAGILAGSSAAVCVSAEESSMTTEEEQAYIE